MNPDLQSAVAHDDPERRRDLQWFVVLAFAFSWLAWLPFVLGYGTELGQLGVLPGAFGPALAALVVTWRADRPVRPWLREALTWRKPGRWYLVALLLPIAVVLTAGVVLGVLGEPTDFGLLADRAVLFVPTLLFMMLLGGGQEELGWRGFALPRLQARFGALGATGILGVVWAVWHLPLFAIETVGQHGTSFLLYAGMVLALTVIFTWLYNATRSVLLAVVLHGSVNASLGVLVPLPLEQVAGDGFETVILAITAVLWVVAIALIVITKGRLGYRASDSVTASADGNVADTQSAT